MRRCVRTGPGLGLLGSHCNLWNQLGATVARGPHALAANAHAVEPFVVGCRASASQPARQFGTQCSLAPGPSSPEVQLGIRNYGLLAVLGAGNRRQCRPAVRGLACSAAATAATASRHGGPSNAEAASVRDLECANSTISQDSIQPQLRTQHAGSAANNSGASSISGGQGGEGPGRRPAVGLGTVAEGPATASAQLPPPHMGLTGNVWGRGAPALGPGRLQVWWTPLDLANTCSAEGTARNRGCITPAEAAEVGGSKSPEVAAKRTAARALARTVLARAVGDGLAEAQAGASSSSAGGGGARVESVQTNGSVERVLPQDLRFARNSHGKPHLVAGGPGWPVLRHNLTHTHDLAGVAVLRQPEASAAGTASTSSNGSPSTSAWTGVVGDGDCGRVVMSVGLDVERLDRAPRDPMALARRRLAAAEVRDLEAITDPKQRARHFMWLWTLKEAYVKARGTGINAPPGLKGFAIGFRDLSAEQRQAVEAAVGNSHGVSPRLTAITITHTCSTATSKSSAASPQVPAPAAAHSAVTGHGATVAAQNDAVAPPPVTAALLQGPQAPPQPVPDADVGPDAHFHFLLFQPTPAHVGALCIATQQQPHGHHHRDLHTATPLSSGGSGSSGSSSNSSSSSSLNGSSKNGDDGASSVSGRSNEIGAHDSGSDCSGSGTCWAAQVDHWWCVPLAAEARLLPQQLMLLGCTWERATDMDVVQPT